jgi:hypothetical protein
MIYFTRIFREAQKPLGLMSKFRELPDRLVDNSGVTSVTPVQMFLFSHEEIFYKMSVSDFVHVT